MQRGGRRDSCAYGREVVRDLVSGGVVIASIHWLDPERVCGESRILSRCRRSPPPVPPSSRGDELFSIPPTPPCRFATSWQSSTRLVPRLRTATSSLSRADPRAPRSPHRLLLPPRSQMSSPALPSPPASASAPGDAPPAPLDGSAPAQRPSVLDAAKTIRPLEDLQRLPNMPCARYSLLFGIVAGVSVGCLRFVFSRTARRGTLMGGGGGAGRWAEVGAAANWAVGAWGVGSLGAWCVCCLPSRRTCASIGMRG